MDNQQANAHSAWRQALLAHAQHYSASASLSAEIILGRCPGKSQLQALQQLAIELENIMLALDTSLAFGLGSSDSLIRLLSLHFSFRGEFGTLYRQFQPLLQRVRSRGDSAAELACLIALSQAAHRTGRTREFQVLAEQALAIATQLPPDDRAVEAHHLVGAYWLLQHDFVRARQYLQAMHELAARLDDRLGLANASAAIGSLEKYEGNFEQAREALDTALAIVANTENHYARAFILNERASLEYLQGNYREARALFSEALSRMLSCGSRFGTAHVLAYLGNVDTAEGKYETAQETYQRALEIQLEHGHMYEAGALLLNLGNTALHLGQLDQSISRSLAALELLRDAVEPHAVATCLQNLGQAYGRSGDFVLATRTMREALQEHVRLADDESIILNCLAAAEGLLLAGLTSPARAIAVAVATQVAQRAMVLEVDERQLLEELLRDAGEEAAPGADGQKHAHTGMTVGQLADITLAALDSLQQSGADAPSDPAPC